MIETNQEASLPKRRVIFRADGNSQIGLGHVTRSLALVSIIKNHFACYFAIQNPSPELIQEIKFHTAIPVLLPGNPDYLEEAHFLRENIFQNGDIIVLDGYNFNLDYQQIIKTLDVAVICIDDIQAYPFVAEAIINTAGGVKPENYQALPETKFYLGPEYALLRAPFLKAAEGNREITGVKKIFLNMGGADPENHTCHIINTILTSGFTLQVEIVIGSAYRHHQALHDLISDNPKINIYQNLNAKAICELMQSCEAAILPPSSVSYEWCSVSGPLFLYQIADNQKFIQKFLLENNLAQPFSNFVNFLKQPEIATAITDQIKNQRQWFNGQSARRLLSVFFELAYHQNLIIRKAEQTDMERLFNWANDPEVRRHSFSSEPISWEVHQIWFKNKLRDPNCLICLAEVNKIPAGMIRFDIANEIATISYLLAQDFRGLGLGSVILQKGLAFLQAQKSEVTKAIGHIQKTNTASIKAFKKNNFTQTENLPGAKTESLVFEKNLK